MSAHAREAFLIELLSILRSQHPEWNICDHCKIEWHSQPRNLWLKADLLIEGPGRRFIVECDEDSDPGRSLTKYWPMIDSGDPLTVIEIWKRGATISYSYAELAKWMGGKLMDLYPSFRYEFVERKGETADTIAKQIAQIVKQT